MDTLGTSGFGALAPLCLGVSPRSKRPPRTPAGFAARIAVSEAILRPVRKRKTRARRYESGLDAPTAGGITAGGREGPVL